MSECWTDMWAFSLLEYQFFFINLEKVKHMWQKLLGIPNRCSILLPCHRTLSSLIVTTFLANFATSCGLLMNPGHWKRHFWNESFLPSSPVWLVTRTWYWAIFGHVGRTTSGGGRMAKPPPTPSLTAYSCAYIWEKLLCSLSHFGLVALG